MQQLQELLSLTAPNHEPLIVDVLKIHLTREQAEQLGVQSQLLDQYWSQPWQGHTIHSLWHWLVRDNWVVAQQLLLKYNQPTALSREFNPRAAYRWTDCLRDLAARQPEPLEEYWEYAIGQLLLVMRVTPPPVRYLINVEGNEWPTIFTSKPPGLETLLDDPRLVHPQATNLFLPAGRQISNVVHKDTSSVQYYLDELVSGRRVLPVNIIHYPCQRAFVESGDFHADYNQWCQTRNLEPVGRKMLSKMVEIAFPTCMGSQRILTPTGSKVVRGLFLDRVGIKI